ncbi:acyl-CoA dehydrogenase family protein [Teichococcus vastitatis]|uniref:Acyl-CoA/acyl-ACP dehydrogenase n=1 Tax=Teichococcus vastitatis TaxID=2307076 RepID=A0ABS9W2Z6_9PROT|nr:acyl-CoA dehydrogenase family protein [Pseudoroseomonas vastitatis]MCI0753659.1 acyl-CoA/acyl-ACP dehydrogenase [Pseudoroseomonas vastitatis]
MSLALHQDAAPDLEALSRAFAARAAEHDRTGRFPHANFAALHAAGLLGLTVPRAQGGQGEGLAAALTAIEAVSRGCASTGLVFAMHLTHQAGIAREAAFPEALRARVGADAVRQGALVNALRVEPELGSPSRGGLPETIARRQPDGSWRLTGRKIYSTGSPGLGWMLVWARDDGDAPRVGPVLVPARAPGVRIEESWDHLGLRATASHDVVFDEVRLEEASLAALRPPAEWRVPDSTGLAWNAAGIGAIYTGVARAAAAWTAQFLRDRVPSGLGKPLATLPRMQEKAGAIEELLTANARLLRSLAAEVDAGAPPGPAESGLLKTTLVENAARAVEIAVGLGGNHALSRRNPLERHWRDVQCGRAHVPHVDFAHQSAGREALEAGA